MLSDRLIDSQNHLAHLVSPSDVYTQSITAQQFPVLPLRIVKIGFKIGMGAINLISFS